MGNTEAYSYESGDKDEPKFPHIYGGISKDSIISYHKICRGEDGSFLSIEDIIS